MIQHRRSELQPDKHLGLSDFYAIACFYNQNTEAFNTGSPNCLVLPSGESL